MPTVTGVAGRLFYAEHTTQPLVLVVETPGGTEGLVEWTSGRVTWLETISGAACAGALAEATARRPKWPGQGGAAAIASGPLFRLSLITQSIGFSI